MSGLRILAAPAFRNRAWNPYQSALYTAIQASEPNAVIRDYGIWNLLARRWDILHLHWPESAFNQPSRARARRWSRNLLRGVDRARRRGARVVWTVHNLEAHEARHPDLEAAFWPQLLRRVDGHVHLSEAARRAAEERFAPLRSLPGFVIPIGHFRGFYADTMDRASARRALEIPGDGPVLLFFGQVRPYKNVPHLMSQFLRLPLENGTLLVAGHADRDIARELEAVVGSMRKIRLHLGYIPDEAVQRFFRAADLVVLPFRKILNSASALLALSFDRPVLVPALGSMQELSARVGADWVRTYPGELTTAVLEEGVRWSRADGRPARCDLSAFDWDAIARMTVQAYRAVLGRAKGRGQPVR